MDDLSLGRARQPPAWRNRQMHGKRRLDGGGLARQSEYVILDNADQFRLVGEPAHEWFASHGRAAHKTALRQPRCTAIISTSSRRFNTLASASNSYDTLAHHSAPCLMDHENNHHSWSGSLGISTKNRTEPPGTSPLRVRPRHGRHLFEGVGSLFQRWSLVAGALRQLLRCGGDLSRRFADLLEALA